MANQEHLNILARGVDEWNRWRLAHRHVRPDLSEANLAEGQLRGVNFGALVDEFHAYRERLRARAQLETMLRHKREEDDFVRLKGEIRHINELLAAELNDFNAPGVKPPGVNLYHADLTLADLRKASLARVELTWAHLTRANLSSSDLTGARLWFTEIVEADVRDTRFDGASFAWTKLCNLDLSTAHGLKAAAHRGPSTVGLDTFVRSNGNIPVEFMRGAGVSEALIKYSQFIGTTPGSSYTFISYSHADQIFARRVHDELQSHGIRCWLDERQLLPGDDIPEKVDHAIRSSEKFLLVCSEHSLNSWWVENEIETVLEQEQKFAAENRIHTRRLIPLNVDGYLFTDAWNSTYRAQIRRRLAADFTGWEHDNAKFEAQVERVVAALRADERARERPPESRLYTPPVPG